MTQDVRARDWWMAPIEIVGGVNDVLYFYAGSPFNVTIDPGLYWPHADTSASYPGIYKQIADEIYGAAGVTVTFSAATPTESVEQYWGGLRMTASQACYIHSSISTFPVEVLGTERGGPNFQTTITGGAHVATSRFSRRYTWRSENIVDGVASRKRAFFERPVSASHDRPADRFALAYEEESYREWVYEYVLAAHIFEDDAAELASYAERARLATGDANNAFETIFRELMSNQAILIAHDAESWPLDDITGLEVVSAYRLDGAIANILRERSTAGEAYDLALSTYILEVL